MIKLVYFENETLMEILEFATTAFTSNTLYMGINCILNLYMKSPIEKQYIKIAYIDNLVVFCSHLYKAAST